MTPAFGTSTLERVEVERSEARAAQLSAQLEATLNRAARALAKTGYRPGFESSGSLGGLENATAEAGMGALPGASLGLGSEWRSSRQRLGDRSVVEARAAVAWAEAETARRRGVQRRHSAKVKRQGASQACVCLFCWLRAQTLTTVMFLWHHCLCLWRERTDG